MPMSRSTRVLAPVLAPVLLVLLLVAGAALARCDFEPRTAIVHTAAASTAHSPVEFDPLPRQRTALTTTTTAPPPTTTTQAPPPPPTTHHRAPVAHKATQGRSSGHWHPGGPCPRPSQCPQLRYCENGRFGYSHGDSPLFDGAYQFDHGSQWGMSPADQDARADAMYADRGADPWPTCGRFLA